MICLLCLGVERDERLIDISIAESRRLNIASIIRTHFGFCFEEEPIEGFVCQKCWVKVSIFHEFYTHIEYVHRSNDSVFAECIVNDSVGSESEIRPKEEASFIKPVDEKPENAPNQKIQIDSDIDDSRHSDGNSEIDFDEASLKMAIHHITDIDSNKPTNQQRKRDERTNADDVVSIEIPSKLKKNVEPKKKRGRPRKFPPEEPQSHKCGRCPLEFSSSSGLSRHIKVEHSVLPIRCKHARCVESFVSQEDHDAHFTTKHRRTECSHCNKMFLESNIEKHIRLQHQSTDAQFMCDLCGKISISNSKHQAHYRKWHEVHSKVQCDICKIWTKHKQALRRHMIRKHIDEPQTCTVCGHISPNRNSLWEHSKKHLPDFKTRWKCVHCGRGFRNKMSLEEHTHIHTGFAGSYHCEDCGKIFRFSSSFSVHKKKMHPK